MAMTWPYVAGFFDGEGNIRLAIGSGCHTAQFSLHQSGERGRLLLAEIKEFFELHGIRCGLQVHKPGKTSRKVMYRLYCYNRSGVLTFIKNAFPYLRIKKLECQDLWRYAVMFPIFRRTATFKGEVERTVCSNGHDLTGANVFVSQGRKGCRICRGAYRSSVYYDRVKPLMEETGMSRRKAMDEIARRRRIEKQQNEAR